MSEDKSVAEMSMARVRVKRNTLGMMASPSQTSLLMENGHLV